MNLETFTLFNFWSSPLLATTAEAESSSLILAGVLLSLAVIYLASKAGGELCARINLPPVLGELVFGVMVGVSVLHLLMFAEAGEDGSHSLIMNLLQATSPMGSTTFSHVFEAQSEVLSVLAEIGVVVLLFEIGLESDLKELLKVGIQSTVVAVIGVITPFVLGTTGLMLLFGTPAIPAIFAGAALTATSIGITAKVLAEMQRLNTREGQIIVGAAVIDDVLGIIVLAVVAGLARDGQVVVSDVVYLVISAAAFFIGAIWIGRLLNPLFVQLVNHMRTRGQVLLSALFFALILSYISATIHLEAILGAFAAGLVLAETEKREELQRQVAPVADVLMPVFFVIVGARTDISVLNPFVPENREGLIMASFLIVVAIVGKVLTGLGVFGQPGINRLAIGVGMVPRGEVGLVFAAIGAATGALSDALNAAIIVMVILTTFLAPPLLRWAFSLSEESATTDPASLSGNISEPVLVESERLQSELVKPEIQ
ncbi:cation:proton antiporter [Kovacikia minuta CCNUW1]|uniref:cation:proton antiporter n=1 Tax=Kovacikia minuta TaxID=2931930 RepID=UPI001CCEE291|nr:cation:proton antiporter [Kovacikia minuta]UBF23617.1 cation:proton antiporter [Kovacikia minuta CCNUW1]